MASVKSRSRRRARHAIGAGWMLAASFTLLLLLSFAGRFWLGISEPFPASMCVTCAVVSSIALADLGGRPVTGLLPELLKWLRNRKT